MYKNQDDFDDSRQGHYNDRNYDRGDRNDRGFDRGNRRHSGGSGYQHRRNDGGGRRGGGRHSDQYRRGGHDDDRSGQQPRREEKDDIQSRLNSLIIRIGDKSTSSLENNLEALAGALESDIPKHKAGIMDILLSCVIAQPVKTPVYGTLVGLLNVKNHDFGKEIVNRFSAALQEALSMCNHANIKFLVRFLGELMCARVIKPFGVITLFEQFVGVINESDVMPERSDFFVNVIIGTLPWVGGELTHSAPEDLNRIMGHIEKHMKDRAQRGNFLDPFEQTDDRNDAMSDLWMRVQAQQDQGWNTSSSILRPYSYFYNSLDTATQHFLPLIRIPPHSGVSSYPFPRPLFRIFDPSDSEVDMSPVDYYVLSEYISDLLFFFNANHKEGVKFLLQLPATANTDHVIVETIVAQLLTLPKPPFKELYYSVLFIDLFKSQPSIIPVFAKSVSLMFEKLPSMDIECVDRFTRWFAVHLSNFDYKWTWSDWESILAPPAEGGEVSQTQALKCRFVTGALEYCMRLSYYERIRQTIPDEFASLMPPKPTTNFKFQDEGTDSAECARILLGKMRTKDHSDIILNYIDMDIAPKFSSEEKLEIVVQTLLQAGSKSFSHLLNSIERYLAIFTYFVKTPGQNQKTGMMQCIANFWEASPQHIIIILDKLMTYRVLDGSNIVNWIFSEANSARLTSFFTWEILFNTINKTLARCETLARELKSGQTSGDRDRQIEVNLEQAHREQRELFLVIFQRFSMVLKTHLAQKDGDSTMVDATSEPQDLWYRCVMGYNKAVARRYLIELKPLVPTLESLIFADADPRICAPLTLMKQLIAESK